MSILTLSGWTQPAEALSEHIPGAHAFDYSDYTSPESAIEALRQFSDIPTIVAWSMGGWLTLQAMHQGALKPKSVLLIAPPFQFVNDAEFRDGMDPTVFKQFRDNYASAPERTSGRFHALVAKGDKHMKRVIEQLSHHPEVTNTARWLPWFDALSRTTLHGISPSNARITILHGTNDAIVPVAQGAHHVANNPKINLELWEEASHAPHLHDTQKFQNKVKSLYAN